jgi:hypothetical protein
VGAFEEGGRRKRRRRQRARVSAHLPAMAGLHSPKHRRLIFRLRLGARDVVRSPDGTYPSTVALYTYAGSNVLADRTLRLTLSLGEHGCRTRGLPTSCRTPRARTASVPRRMRIDEAYESSKMLFLLFGSYAAAWAHAMWWHGPGTTWHSAHLHPLCAAADRLQAVPSA